MHSSQELHNYSYSVSDWLKYWYFIRFNQSTGSSHIIRVIYVILDWENKVLGLVYWVMTRLFLNIHPIA